MARNKRNERQVCSMEAVWEAGTALMGLIHPLCELRTMDQHGDPTCTVVSQDPTSLLMAAVADRAAEAVVPNNEMPRNIFAGVQNLATSLEMAATILGNPLEGADDEQMLQTVTLVDAVTQAVASVFSQDCYRRALSALARRLEREPKPSMGEIAALVGPWPPKLERTKQDVDGGYIRMGWVAS